MPNLIKLKKKNVPAGAQAVRVSQIELASEGFDWGAPAPAAAADDDDADLEALASAMAVRHTRPPPPRT